MALRQTLHRRLIPWLVMMAMVPSCAPRMIVSYEEAQRRARQQDRPLFVFYGSWESTDCGAVKAAIQTPPVQSRLNGTVQSDLDELWEPNRRFVAQYGVDRFPAVILIHTDGTYHSHVGRMDTAQLVGFLENSKPPGRQPQVNTQIPRRMEYRWMGDFNRAVARGHQRKQSVFVFYKSVISPESNDMFFNVLNHPHVASMFEDTVNCLLDWGHAPNRRIMAGYGVGNVPAVLLIRPDGSYHARQGRLTAAELAAFIRQAEAQPGRPAPNS